MASARSLVLGDGFLAQGIIKGLRSRGMDYVVSSRRPKGPNQFYLELAQTQQWVFPEGVRVAYLCAGFTGRERCSRAPESSRLINVDGVNKFISQCMKRKVRIIYASTVEVFSGEDPFNKISKIPTPTSEYGRQKREFERRLLSMPESGVVIRMTKILSRESQLIQKWRCRLENVEKVTAFSDIQISPVSLTYASDAMIEMGESELAGPLHISGQGQHSYHEVCERYAGRMGYPLNLVVAEKGKHRAPLYASLDMSENPPGTRNPQPLEEVLEEICSDASEK
jgi:dTDP-4-dehydrorhamnose reductase